MVFASYTPASASRTRSTSLVVSIAVHAAILVALFGLRHAVSPAPRVSATQLLYVPPSKPEARPVKAPAPRMIAPPRLAVLPKLGAPQQPQLTVSFPAPPELAVAQPVQLPDVQPVAIAAAPIPVKALPPSGFASVPLAAAPPATAKLPVTTGAFEAAQAGSRRSSNAVVSAGFGEAATVAAAVRPQAGVVGAFGSAVTAEPGNRSATPRPVAAEPLEILDKPRPAYTESARKARVEGDVLLEVLFAKTGTLRVLRVVRGLGYGLEQNATDAAAKIRFRPAKEDGRAVDMVAMVRISFQMAY
jgi:protein TonB